MSKFLSQKFNLILDSDFSFILKVFVILLALFFISFYSRADEQTKNTTANWITSEELYSENEFKSQAVVYFRNQFDINIVPRQLLLRVSADNRYKLYVNGVQVAAGPPRSDLSHWNYDSVDISEFLVEGKNVISAVVWNWGKLKPLAQFSFATGLYVQTDSTFADRINTSSRWKALLSKSHTFQKVEWEQAGGYYAAPPQEIISGSSYPWDWLEAEYSDSDWPHAALVNSGQFVSGGYKGVHPYGMIEGWQLVPSKIPQMEEKKIAFDSIRLAENVDGHGDFLEGKSPIVIPPNTKARIVFDQSHLTNAYPLISLTGGDDSQVVLTYAESFREKDGTKGNRSEILDKEILGISDTIYPDGKSNRVYQTLWFRTYRYVQVEVQTGSESLKINSFEGIYTGYPFELMAKFESDDPSLTDIWDMNWRILRLCAFDTYVDTPYYEQLQYIGDTRIQALSSIYLSNDTRLVKRALDLFDLSRIPEGITASRYPSNIEQYIPPFSLVWVLMVHDYWMLVDDMETVKGYLNGMRAVLAWFENQVGADNIMGPIPWWPFVDWTPDWERGIPPGALGGGSVLLSLQYSYVLQKAAEIEEQLGSVEIANNYKRQAAAINLSAQSKAWDSDKEMFKDSLSSSSFSQQTNIMALLSNAVPTESVDRLVNTLLNDKSLTQSSYYYLFYLFEALEHVGEVGSYKTHLKPWFEMLSKGLTTTPESPDPTRSDSHAWAAHPNYGLLSIVLGVRSSAPGFRAVTISPNLSGFNQLRGQIPHSKGIIDIEFWKSNGKWNCSIVLPSGLNGVLQMERQVLELEPGENYCE